MKKLLLTLLCLPIIGFGQTLLTYDDIREAYPNVIGTYHDVDGEMLFDGKGYDQNHPDTKRIDHYIYLCFSGDLLESDAVTITLKAGEDGLLYEKEISVRFAKWNGVSPGETILRFDMIEGKMIFEY